jgi:hypothetical protein
VAEDIALLGEIVANDAHMCRRGNVTEIFEEVRALNEGNALPRNSNGKHCNDRYKLLLANFRRADRARTLASGTDEEFGKKDLQLADIQSADNNYEERGQTEREESAKRDESLAHSSRALSGHDVSQPLFYQCSLLLFVLPKEGFAAAARCLASTAPGRRRGRLTRDSDSAAAEACWYMPLAATYFLRFVSIFMVSYRRGYGRSCRNYVDTI